MRYIRYGARADGVAGGKLYSGGHLHQHLRRAEHAEFQCDGERRLILLKQFFELEQFFFEQLKLFGRRVGAGRQSRDLGGRAGSIGSKSW